MALDRPVHALGAADGTTAPAAAAPGTAVHWRDKRTCGALAPVPAKGWPGQGISIDPEQGRLEGIGFPALLAFSDKRETARATLIRRM